MAEYLPLYKPGATITRQASATITAGQLVIVTGSGTVGPGSAATHLWLGVAAHDAVSGDKVTIHCGGVQRLVAAGGITAGVPVEAAAAGAVATKTIAAGETDLQVVGIALTTALDTALVEVAMVR